MGALILSDFAGLAPMVMVLLKIRKGSPIEIHPLAFLRPATDTTKPLHSWRIFHLSQLRDPLARRQKMTVGRAIPLIFRARAQSLHIVEWQCLTPLPSRARRIIHPAPTSRPPPPRISGGIRPSACRQNEAGHDCDHGREADEGNACPSGWVL